jgi:hypothetical protein
MNPKTHCQNISFVSTVGCLNNDRSVMSKSYAWRPLATFPILRHSAPSIHESHYSGHQWAVLQRHCHIDIHFADDKMWNSRDFLSSFCEIWSWMAPRWLLHFSEIMSTNSLCAVCTCPHSELDWTDVSYPYHNTESVKRNVDAAQSGHYQNASYTVITNVSAKHQPGPSRFRGTPYHTRYWLWYRPGGHLTPISGYPILNPILNPISAICTYWCRDTQYWTRYWTRYR